ncbi:MAG: hypothetical protein ACLFVN_09780 [Phycisphaeraceae bacterium]
MTVALENPGANRSNPVLAGGDIGTTGTVFYIKVFKGSHAFGSPLQEITGDGDTTPQFENNGLLYGDVSIRGAMLASQEVGLEQMVSANNPIAVVFVLGGTRKLGYTLQVGRAVIGWSSKQRVVGITLAGKIVNTAPGAIEQAVT